MEPITPNPIRDRRCEPRQAAELVVLFTPVRGERPQGPWGRTVDASRHGMFVATAHPLPPRSVVVVEAFLSDSGERPVRARAVVRWRRRWRQPRGMGLELIRIGEDERERLDGWIRRVEETPPLPAEDGR